MKTMIFYCIFIINIIYGQTYYISNSGNDDWLGTTIDKPWKTLMRVKRAADQSVFKPGDIISFKKGDIWYESLDLSNSPDGLDDKHITLNSYPYLDPRYPIFDGSNSLETGIILQSKYYNIEDIEIRNYITEGIKAIRDNLYIIIDNLFIHDIGIIQPPNPSHIDRIHGVSLIGNNTEISNSTISEIRNDCIFIIGSNSIISYNSLLNYGEGDNSIIHWGDGIEIHNGTDNCISENFISTKNENSKNFIKIDGAGVDVYNNVLQKSTLGIVVDYASVSNKRANIFNNHLGWNNGLIKEFGIRVNNNGTTPGNSINIYNNIIENCQEGGVQIISSLDVVTIYSNTIVNTNNNQGFCLEISSDVITPRLRNNIFYAEDLPSLKAFHFPNDSNPPTNITFSNNNLFYSTNSNLIIFKIGSQYEYNWNEWILGGYEALSRNEDPIFENNEQPYMITSGSPAIDLGETLPNEFAFDFLGKTRPFNDLFDAGVYEYYDVQKKMILSSMEHELSEFELFNNFPNPFNPSTTINFSLAADSKVSLKIFDVIGQEVAQLVNGQLAAGQHNVNFDARSLNSGVYFYKIEANGVDGTSYSSVKKMILTK